jgi:hypothetical protein
MPGGFRWTFTRLPRRAASPNVVYQVPYPGNNEPSALCSKNGANADKNSKIKKSESDH